MKIHIHYNYTITTESYNSYGVLEELIKSGKDDTYITHCLDFFSFDYINQVEDVIIIKYENFKYWKISLSELLNKDLCKFYTDREIRHAHNVRKMFVANCFNWRWM